MTSFIFAALAVGAYIARYAATARKQGMYYDARRTSRIYANQLGDDAVRVIRHPSIEKQTIHGVTANEAHSVTIAVIAAYIAGQTGTGVLPLLLFVLAVYAAAHASAREWQTWINRGLGLPDIWEEEPKTWDLVVWKWLRWFFRWTGFLSFDGEKVYVPKYTTGQGRIWQARLGLIVMLILLSLYLVIMNGDPHGQAMERRGEKQILTRIENRDQ